MLFSPLLELRFDNKTCIEYEWQDTTTCTIRLKPRLKTNSSVVSATGSQKSVFDCNVAVQELQTVLKFTPVVHTSKRDITEKHQGQQDDITVSSSCRTLNANEKQMEQSIGCGDTTNGDGRTGDRDEVNNGAQKPDKEAFSGLEATAALQSVQGSSYSSSDATDIAAGTPCSSLQGRVDGSIAASRSPDESDDFQSEDESPKASSPPRVSSASISDVPSSSCNQVTHVLRNELQTESCEDDGCLREASPRCPPANSSFEQDSSPLSTNILTGSSCTMYEHDADPVQAHPASTQIVNGGAGTTVQHDIDGESCSSESQNFQLFKAMEKEIASNQAILRVRYEEWMTEPSKFYDGVRGRDALITYCANELERQETGIHFAFLKLALFHEWSKILKSYRDRNEKSVKSMFLKQVYKEYGNYTEARQKSLRRKCNIWINDGRCIYKIATRFHEGFLLFIPIWLKEDKYV